MRPASLFGKIRYIKFAFEDGIGWSVIRNYTVFCRGEDQVAGVALTRQFYVVANVLVYGLTVLGPQCLMLIGSDTNVLT